MQTSTFKTAATANGSATTSRLVKTIFACVTTRIVIYAPLLA